MKKVMSIAAVALFAFAGCTSYHTDRATQAQVEPVSYAGPGYHTEWKVADQRAKGEGCARAWFGIWTSGDSKYADVPGLHVPFFARDRAILRAKSSATYNAIEQTKADALLGAAYKYTVTNCLFFTTVKCEVVGFPADVTGVKLHEDQPVLVDKTKEIIRIKPWERVTVPQLEYRNESAPAAASPSAPPLLKLLFPIL